VGAYAQALGPARTQQKTSALGKPDANLFIARTDILTRDRHATDTTYQPARQSDSTQLKSGNSDDRQTDRHQDILTDILTSGQIDTSTDFKGR